MNTKQYRYLVTINEKGSISEAAKALYMEQSALSHFLIKLENEIGAPLFLRTNPIVPTYLGEIYLTAAARILSEEDILSRQVKSVIDNEHGRITIGSPQRIAEYILPLIWPEYCKTHPSIELRLVIAAREKMDSLLEGGKIDLTFTTRKNKMSAVHYEPLIDEDLVLLTPKKYYREGILQIPEKGCLASAVIHQYADLPFILINKEHNLRASCERFFQQAHIEPRVSIELDNASLCATFAARGLGVTIVPSGVVTDSRWRNDTLAIPLDREFKRTIMLCYRTHEYVPDYFKDFISIATSYNYSSSMT